MVEHGARRYESQTNFIPSTSVLAVVQPDLHALLNPRSKFAPRIVKICRQRLEDAQDASIPQEIELARLELNTWTLLQVLAAAANFLSNSIYTDVDACASHSARSAALDGARHCARMATRYRSSTIYSRSNDGILEFYETYVGSESKNVHDASCRDSRRARFRRDEQTRQSSSFG